MNKIRAALYVRVSTEEQARDGYSVSAQKSNLLRYAKEHDYSVVGIYVDEGITARKKYKNRQAFMRLMDDVENDKVDLILFIKLDRWFRNVGDYYKIQEVLDAHGVQWKATTERYDTQTANGRLYVNIRLAVAQDESDRTSERIRFIFEKKIADGEVLSGNPTFGYKIENKHLVKNPETAPILQSIFRSYPRIRSIRGVQREINAQYHLNYSYHFFYRILRENLIFYTGLYRGNPNYAPPYITQEEYEELKAITDSSVHVHTGNKLYTYIFSGLLRCGVCGHNMGGSGYSVSTCGRKFRSYRCPECLRIGKNSGHGQITEETLENNLFRVLGPEIERYKVSLQVVKPKAESLDHLEAKAASIKRKLSRLSTLYLNESINLEDYEEKYQILTAELQEVYAAKAPDPPRDFSSLDRLLSSDFRSVYDTLSNLDKRELWNSVISSIVILDGKILKINFK